MTASPGRMWDTAWLQKILPADEFAAVQKANVNDPKAAELYGIQARNLKRLSEFHCFLLANTQNRC